MSDVAVRSAEGGGPTLATALPGSRRSGPFLALVVVVAVGVGGLASLSPTLAVAGVVAAIAVPGAILRPKIIPHLLVVTVFAEALTVGGVTVGRLAAPLAVIAVASHALNHPVRLVGSRATLRWIGGYVVLAIASLLWSVSSGYTLYALASLAIALVYGAAFAVLVEDRHDLRRLLWTVAVSSSALGLWWIRSYLAGVDRFSTGAGDPNFLAAFQAVAIPLAIALAAHTPTPMKRAILYLAAAVIAGSIIATLSRGGSLTLLAVILLLAVVPARALFRSRTRKATFFVLAAAGLALFLLLAGGQLSQRFQIGLQQSNVVGSRGDLWLAAVHGYQERPLLGLGYGGFKAESYQLLSTTPGVNLPFHQAFRLRAGEFVHNVYLGTLTELGPLGLVLFLGILGATARALIRTAGRARAAGRQFERSAANALMVGLVAFCVASIFLSSESSRALWLIVGLALALPGVVHSDDWTPASDLGPRSLDPPAEPAAGWMP